MRRTAPAAGRNVTKVSIGKLILKQQIPQEYDDAQKDDQGVVFDQPALDEAQRLAGKTRGRGSPVDRPVDDLEIEGVIDGLGAVDHGLDEGGVVDLVHIIFIVKQLIDRREPGDNPVRGPRRSQIEDIGDIYPVQRYGPGCQDEQQLGTDAQVALMAGMDDRLEKAAEKIGLLAKDERGPRLSPAR